MASSDERDEVVGVTLRVAWGKRGAELEGRARACLPASVPATPSEPDMIDRDRSKTRPRARCGVRPPRPVRESREVSFRCQLRADLCEYDTTCAVATYYFLGASPLAPVARASRVNISEPRAIRAHTSRALVSPRPSHFRGGGVGRRRLLPDGAVVARDGTRMPTVSRTRRTRPSSRGPTRWTRRPPPGARRGRTVPRCPPYPR